MNAAVVEKRYDDSGRLEFGLANRKRTKANQNARSGVCVDDAKDPRVAMTECEGERREILIPRHEHTPLLIRALHDRRVARIELPLAGPDDVIPCIANRRHETRREAVIDQQLHSLP